MIFRLAIVASILVVTTGELRAEPITIALFGSAFAATFAGSVVTFLITAAVATGVSLLSNALRKKAQSAAVETSQPGIQFDVQMGENTPIAFTVGTTATAGTRKYIGSWGQVGDTPNAFLTDVIQIGDRSAPGLPGIWINGQKCSLTTTSPSSGASGADMLTEAVAATLAAGLVPFFTEAGRAFFANYILTHTGSALDTGGVSNLGYPVLEFRLNGRDHVWIRYRDGTEADADPFLLEKFGTHPERPWKPTLIGRGCPHLIITTLYNRELFTGNPTYLIEPPETPWYDVRLDDTAGGDGDHRWDDPSTWAPTSNPIVIAYNILRGVSYDGEWLYGGQNLAAFRLPAASFMAAANECEVERELEDDESEPQYRCGMEVRGDMEPLDVIAELMKSCAGRLAEVGGIFKPLVGAPGSAVYAFTDGDILVTKGQSYAPFPTLDDTHNKIEGSYPEPAEMWESKDAPARQAPELEAADDNRQLPTPVRFPAAPFARQVQQLMTIMLDEDRRFRQHSFYLPPDAFPLEPNDVVSWTSERNGYVNKKFLIVRIVGERTSNQLVHLKEIDPADYSPLPVEQQVPPVTGPLSIVRPPAQPMTGWQALPATIDDGAGKPRRPSIRVYYAGNQADVRAVRIQVRVADELAPMFDGEQPYGEVEDAIKSVTLNGTFLPATAYEARGRFVPYSGRATEWSAWLAVTTPDLKFTIADFDAGMRDFLTRHLPARIDAIDFKAQQIAANAVEQDAANELTNRAVRTLLQAQGVTISETAQIALGINGKLTGAVFNTIDNNGFVTGTWHFNDGTTAPFAIVATDFYVAAPGVNGGEPVNVFRLDTTGGSTAIYFDGDYNSPGSIKAYHIEVASLTSISAHFGNAQVDGVLTGGPTGLMELNFTAPSLKFFREV